MTSQRARRRTIAALRVVVPLALVLGVGPRPAGAQELPEERHKGHSYQVGDADELRRRLDDFERLSVAGDWELAIDELQALLDVPPEYGL